MKNIKKLKSDTNKILDEIKKEHDDEFTRVNQFQTKLEEYYKNNIGNYSDDTILQMYKYILKEKKNRTNNYISVLNGVMGGFIVALILNISDDSKGDFFTKWLYMIFCAAFMAILLIIFILSISKNNIDNSLLYDQVHLEKLQKILKEKGFCLCKGEET